MTQQRTEEAKNARKMKDKAQLEGLQAEKQRQVMEDTVGLAERLANSQQQSDLTAHMKQQREEDARNARKMKDRAQLEGLQAEKQRQVMEETVGLAEKLANSQQQSELAAYMKESREWADKEARMLKDKGQLEGLQAEKDRQVFLDTVGRAELLANSAMINDLNEMNKFEREQ